MALTNGLSSPVLLADSVEWSRSYEHASLAELVAMNDEQLAAVDPLAMNLVVAKRIQSFADLNIGRYQTILDNWVTDFTDGCLPGWEPFFHQSPHDFRNDIDFFRLGMACQYLEQEVGIEYIREQREAVSILYTDPSDLFLNGVLDTRQGTCGNMAALYVAFGWRLGWPVSIACINSHFICRFDNGRVIHNIESTQAGYGGFSSPTDEFLVEKFQLSERALASGSDLRALRPREMLGLFIGFRARHLQDVGKAKGDKPKIIASESDWLLARFLCPTNRQLFRNAMVTTTIRGETLFESGEAGHPLTYAGCLEEIRLRRQQRRAWAGNSSRQLPNNRSSQVIDELFSQSEVKP